MSLEELQILIANTDWFVRCGQFAEEAGTLALAKAASSNRWEWLPTSHTQTDPIYGDTLRSELYIGGNDQVRQAAELAISKCVMKSLRKVPDLVPILIDGPHDFTTAAKSGAVFAARMATRELLVGRSATWNRVIQFFVAGYWPCGWSAENQSIVVF